MELSMRLSGLKTRYGISEKDIVYCDLVHAGWNKTEAAFYALNLAIANTSKINTFMTEYISNRPGISMYLKDLEESSRAYELKMEKLKTAEAERRAKVEMDAARATMQANSPASDDEMTEIEKEDLIKFYSSVIRDPHMDAKTRMDAAKGLSDLKQMKKEVTKEEDNRTHFYLPLSCHKCSLFIANEEKMKNNRETQNNTENEHREDDTDA